MRNGERCGLVPRHALLPVLTTLCPCHLSHVSHRLARCPLLMSPVSSYSYPLAVEPWGVCLRRVSYSTSFVSVLSAFALHVHASSPLSLRRSGIFFVSIPVKCVSGTCHKHVSIESRIKETKADEHLLGWCQLHAALLHSPAC